MAEVMTWDEFFAEVRRELATSRAVSQHLTRNGHIEFPISGRVTPRTFGEVASLLKMEYGFARVGFEFLRGGGVVMHCFEFNRRRRANA